MFREFPRKTLSILVIVTITVLDWNFVSAPIQGFCLSHMEKMLSLKAFLPSLVCGKRLSTDSELYKTLSHLGLIHIFVISGAHLVSIQWLLHHFIPRRSLIWILLIYTLFAGAGPPVVRAWLVLWIIDLQIFGEKFTPGILGLSVAFTFLFLPHWETVSLSVSLSWVAVATLMWMRRSRFSLGVLYVTLFPLLLGLQVPHPLTILVNAIISPIVFFILMPLSYVVWTLPWMEKFLSLIWIAFFNVLQFLQKGIPEPSTPNISLSLFQSILYATLLHGALWALYIRKKRLKCQRISSYL